MKKEPFQLEPKVEKYYKIIILRQWLIILALWLTLGLFALWELRAEISLWQEYFTWSAVRYALVYHRLAALALGICLGLTTGVLVRQSKDILWGFSDQEKYRLQQQVDKIMIQGQSHPLYKYLSDSLDQS